MNKYNLSIVFTYMTGSLMEEHKYKYSIEACDKYDASRQCIEYAIAHASQLQGICQVAETTQGLNFAIGVLRNSYGHHYSGDRRWPSQDGNTYTTFACGEEIRVSFSYTVRSVMK